MSDEKVFLLVGTCGEYSDKAVWYIAVFTDRAEADLERERFGDLLKAAAQEEPVDNYEDEFESPAFALLLKSDPQYNGNDECNYMHPSYDRGAGYGVVEVPFRFAKVVAPSLPRNPAATEQT